MSTVVIAECKEPWIYWWELLTAEERKAFKEKYFPKAVYLITEEIKKTWEQEKPEPLSDEDWLQLATAIFDPHRAYPRLYAQEIWRQVYRIASERI
jgi:hypothetical protein